MIISIVKIGRYIGRENQITLHANEQRKNRIDFANSLITNEKGILLDSFLVDKGHKNGKEIHNIYSNGIVKIYNSNTKKLITILIARKNQILRYYEVCGILRYMDVKIIGFCERHERENFNRL